jgi:hypothetical protein
MDSFFTRASQGRVNRLTVNLVLVLLFSFHFRLLFLRITETRKWYKDFVVQLTSHSWMVESCFP